MTRALLAQLNESVGQIASRCHIRNKCFGIKPEIESMASAEWYDSKMKSTDVSGGVSDALCCFNVNFLENLRGLNGHRKDSGYVTVAIDEHDL